MVICSSFFRLAQCQHTQSYCSFDPFWNSLVVAGMQDGAPFVGFVSMIGVSYSDNYVTTGFASHLGLPLLREHYRPDITEEEASELLQKALKVRDSSDSQRFFPCLALPTVRLVQFALVNTDMDNLDVSVIRTFFREVTIPVHHTTLTFLYRPHPFADQNYEDRQIRNDHSIVQQSVTLGLSVCQH